MQCIRCGLLIQMLHVAWSVSVCLLGTWVSCANTDEPMKMPFGLTHVGQKNHVLDGVKTGGIHFQLQGVTSRQCSLLPNYSGHLLSLKPTCTTDRFSLNMKNRQTME